MPDHDPLCPKRGLHPADEAMMAVVVKCRCEEYARVRADEREQVGRVWAKREDLLLGDIEVARADERAALNGKLLRLYTQNTHAEAVAAKLVEVICDDAAVMAWDLKALEATARERDAARAERLEALQKVAALDDQLATARTEVAALSAEINRMVGELSSIRMEHESEVAALREQMAGTYQAETFTDTDGYPSIRIIKSAERVGENEWAAYIRREVLTDLRAKAEVLPERADAHTEECPGRPGYRGICTCEGDILISRAAVLTLFDEAAR